MRLMETINNDPEIKRMKEIIYKATGLHKGILFWDGETIEQYKKRLREEVQMLNNEGRI